MRSMSYGFPSPALIFTNTIVLPQVSTRPIIPDPNGVLADIYVCLCEAGLAPFGKNHKFDFM
jgi:hypothetical protein